MPDRHAAGLFVAAPCQTLFRQIDTQRTLVAEAQRVVYGAILAHFVVGHIADEVAVICQTIGEHQRLALQALGNADLAKPHGAEDQAVRTVRQHQVDVLVGGRVAEQVEDKDIPAGLLRGLFNGQQQLDREGRGRGVQREHADGARLQVVTAHLAR